MAEQKIITNNAVLTIRYRAICESGDYTGDWRDQEELAYEDAIMHQNKNGSHRVDIEVEQRQKYIKRID